MNCAKKQTIEDIMKNLSCPNDFDCYKPLSTDDKSTINHIGLDSYVMCRKKGPAHCPYSVPFGESFFCKCPPGVYAAKNDKK